MKAMSIPAEMLGDSEHTLIGAEDGDDISVLVTRGVDDDPRYSVRCQLDAHDLKKLNEGGAVWVTFFSRDFPPFVIFTEG